MPGVSPTLYFYLHLPVIRELWVFIPFTPFETGFLANANVAPSQTTPNIWSIIVAFEIVCQCLGVLLTVGITLRLLSGKGLLELYMAPFEDWREIFVRVIEYDGTSMVTNYAIDAPRFLFSKMNDY